MSHKFPPENLTGHRVSVKPNIEVYAYRPDSKSLFPDGIVTAKPGQPITGVVTGGFGAMRLGMGRAIFLRLDDPAGWSARVEDFQLGKYIGPAEEATNGDD